MKRSLALILLALMVAAGCGAFKNKDEEMKTWSAQRLYSEAKDEMNSGNYEKAVKLFEMLEARYPFGRYAQQAQLDMAYAYYRDNEPLQSIATSERFMKLHPSHPNLDYAYYLKGLANFQDDLGLFGFLSNPDLTDKDPKALREAFDAFKELTTRFPDSKYAGDALKRMNYLVNALSAHEVHVARYYYRRGAYLAAINRAQYALINYPQTPALEDGLQIMMQSYEALGMKDLREDTARVFKQNFPKSEFLQASSKKSWWRFWNR